MRKFLSLVLALVMMMSLITINTGAVEFTDGDDITYQEAVDVISAIHVVDGYSNGSFNPSGNLTRGAAAKIICNLILGPTTASQLHADTAPFRDVPVNHDFAGYIAYCQKEGIVGGYGDGTFRPAGTLTGNAFMKMLLGALGYDAEIEQYGGPNWSINVAKRAIGIGLDKGLEEAFDGTKFITREEAALYSLNTLKADLVEYDQKITANVNGAEVTIGNSQATSQKWESSSQASRMNNIRKDDYIQFAEEYFNKLVLEEAEDVFGRPDREWTFDGDEIGSYVNMDLFKQEYTTEVTGKELRDLLGGTVVDKYHFNITVDGIDAINDAEVLDSNSDGDVYHFTQGNLVRTNTKGVGGTGKGVWTQVFVDNDNQNPTVWISVINTYLAKATDDYDEKKEEADFEVYSLEDVNKPADPILVKNVDKDGATSGRQPETVDLTVKNEDINVEDVKEDDIVLVRVADGEIQEILDPEVIEETEISSFKNGDWVKADEQYDYANSTSYDPEVLDQYVKDNMKDTTYNLYLDPFGYMIGIEIVEETTNYLFLTGVDGKTSNLANKTAEGNVILLDGTMDTVTIKLGDSVYADGCKMSVTTDSDNGDCAKGNDHSLNALMNTWCKYTVNKNGDYVLTEMPNSDATWSTSNKKAAQSHVVDDQTETATTTFANYGTIDKKHVSTLGITDSDVKMAYGHDDTVYIVVSTGLVRATRPNQVVTGQNDALIIDDVDSVTVGVQNANLKAWTAAEVLNNATTRGSIAFDKQATKPFGAPPDDAYKPGRLDSVANGVHNLFDDDGGLIAAIVVGEDSGSTTQYAYTISGEVAQESYNKEDEKWTWTRKVIVNGEVTEISEITDGKAPDISKMVRGQWYELKYKADGTVKSAALIGWDESYDGVSSPFETASALNVVGEFRADDNATGNKFIGLVRKVENSVVNNDTVVLATDLTGTNDNGTGISVPTTADDYDSINPQNRGVTLGTNIITTTGNTLWIENSILNQKDGFAVRNDAKVVLVQDTHTIRNGNVINVSVMDNVYEYSQTGKEALAKMVKDLMDNKNFSGFISAVFDGGVATSVVVWDQTPDIINAGGDIGPSGRYMDNKSTVAEINEALQDGNVIIKDSWSPTRVTGEVRKLNIPRGRTLTIEKDFDAVYEGVAVHLEDGVGVGTLNVGGTYTMAYDTTDTINYNIVASDMRILREGGRLNGTIQPYGVTIASTVKVANDLAIQNATAQTPSVVYELKVARGADVAVGGDVVSMVFSTGAVDTANPNDVWVWIDGHMEVDGSMVPHSYVTYPSSLIVGDEMIGTLILNNGKATIGTMTGDIKLQNANDQLIITDEISGKITQVTKDAKIILNKGVVVSDDAAAAIGVSDGDTMSAAVTLKVTATAGDADATDNITGKIENAGEGEIPVTPDPVVLKLPVGYSYAWAAGADWEAKEKTTFTDEDSSEGIEVPVGATVTVTVGGENSEKYYVLDPNVTEDATASDYKTKDGTFTLTAEADTPLDCSDLADTKYYKVSAVALGTAVTDNGISYNIKPIADTFKAADGTITVTVTATGKATTDDAGTNQTLSAADVSGMTFTISSPTITVPTTANGTYADADFTVQLGGTPTAKDIAIVFAIEAAE